MEPRSFDRKATRAIPTAQPEAAVARPRETGAGSQHVGLRPGASIARSPLRVGLTRPPARRPIAAEALTEKCSVVAERRPGGARRSADRALRGVRSVDRVGG